MELNGGELTPTAAGEKEHKKIDIQKELAEYRQAMRTMTSTLVETVSIDYEDFNESFLTCGTCLCMYDGGEHTPKLLPCSHTVCLQCLDRIVATFARDTGQFRCPICRELITIPRGGVSALPPSFLVNQLLDLMARQRREVIPKCSTHHNQELLFCETCDTVFCTLCTGGSHNPSDEDNSSPTHNSNTVDHTVIPFSIAIKRMSEILIYKANECRAKLNEANDIVNNEIHRLDHNADDAFERVNARFQTVIDCVEKRRLEVLNEVKAKRDEKKKVLEDQLQIIQQEKLKVDNDVQTMQHQVEVRNITKKISDLNCKLDTVSTLSDPRENSYIEYAISDHTTSGEDKNSDVMLAVISEQLSNVGRVKTSKTFPSLCRCSMETIVAHLEATAKITTIDYNGVVQSEGGDPVTAEVLDDKGETVPCIVVDKQDGSYEVRFTPQRSGTFCLKVLIFGRPIKDCPLFFDVTDHNAPVVSFGNHGAKEKGFIQPCNVAVDSKNHLYVIDTGNSRIKKLSSNLDFEGHIANACLEGRSATGICMGPGDQDSLFVINWRTKTVAQISLVDGETINSFTHEEFATPIDLTLDLNDQILVADDELGKLFVFDLSGELLKSISPPKLEKKESNKLSAVCVNPLTGDYVLASGPNILIFKPDGTLLRTIKGQKGTTYGGLSCDINGYLLATQNRSKHCFIQVYDYAKGSLYSSIDSHGSKMKRPMGLSTMEDRYLAVVDIGSDCVRKYRYF